MNLNDERLKSDIKDFGGYAYPSEHFSPGAQMGMTLRDAFAKDAPISFTDAIETYIAEYGQNPTYCELYEFLAQMRYGYADAMLAERVK